MTINLTSIPTLLSECKIFAVDKVNEQIKDAETGDSRAAYSYGRVDSVDKRTPEERIEDTYIGNIAEALACEATKTKWTKERGQYKGNRRPDLTVIYNGKTLKCESRGTRSDNGVVYRERDRKRPTDLLVVTINLPNGPVCEVRHAFFGDLEKLVDSHPEWRGHKPGAIYYRVPFEHLSSDFSKFGN